MDSRATVFVIDDDASVRKSLSRLLRSLGFEVEIFASAEHFLAREAYQGVGCIVLDVSMPGLSGIDLQERLGKADYNLPVVFLTGHGTVPASAKAFKAGAVDFLEKPIEEKDLLEAVSRGIEKHRHLRQEHDELKRLRALLDTLTSREREVFRLVVSGMLNKQVAFDLGITEKTIKVHRAHVMEKMGAESLADLVRFAEKLRIQS
jgi:FixJ family two-component response regulator